MNLSHILTLAILAATQISWSIGKFFPEVSRSMRFFKHQNVRSVCSESPKNCTLTQKKMISFSNFLVSTGHGRT